MDKEPLCLYIPSSLQAGWMLLLLPSAAEDVLLMHLLLRGVIFVMIYFY